MATPVVQFPPYQTSQRPAFFQVWLPVLCGLAVICCESTQMMGASTTGKWLSDLWPRMLAKWEPMTCDAVNHVLRKLGHITGYGTLGLLLRRAWQSSIRIYLHIVGSRLLFAASALSVLFTFIVGGLDEWHQSMLPGRTSSFHDVLVDTSGALLFNVIFWTTLYLRRRAAQRRQLQLNAG
jgi:VanZ family protein